MNGRFDLGAVTKVADLIKQQGIDVIHTHGYKSDILGVMAARKRVCVLLHRMVLRTQ